MRQDISLQVANAVSRAVPLIHITTPDQTELLRVLVFSEQEFWADFTKVGWDVINGLHPMDQRGSLALIYAAAGKESYQRAATSLGTRDAPGNQEDYKKFLQETLAFLKKETVKFASAIEVGRKLPPGTAVFVKNAHLALRSTQATFPDNVQAIMNIRDVFERPVAGAPRPATRHLILLTPPDSPPLPSEIKQDVYVIDDPYPDDDERREIIGGIVPQEAALSPDLMTAAVDCTRAMSRFAIKQETALSLTRNGLDIDLLSRKAIDFINQTEGLTVYPGKETLDQIGGIGFAKGHLTSLIDADKPGNIIFIDEIDKDTGGMAGESNDSGATQGVHGEILKWMVNRGVYSILCVGTGGTGKSVLAKAAGNYAGVWTMQFEIQAMKSRYVGDSVRNFRLATKVADQASRYSLLIATANRPWAISAELMSRFDDILYFPMPAKDELAKIWEIHLGMRGVTDRDIPDDRGWVGRDVMKCVRKADKFRKPLREMARTISPAYKTHMADIAKLEQYAADQGYISAVKGGPYVPPAQGDIYMPDFMGDVTARDISLNSL